nr:MAG TPA: hypothetical protein [Caudoviricetes sp.]
MKSTLTFFISLSLELWHDRGDVKVAEVPR